MNTSYYMASYFVNSPKNRVATKDAYYKSTLANVISTYLYDGQVVISDSFLINGPELRHAIKHNDIIRWLVKDKAILLTVRENNKAMVPLETIAKGIYNKGSKNKIMTDEEFLDFSDLRFLEEYAHKIPYDLSKAKDYYTDNVYYHYKNDGFNGALPEYVRNILLEEFNKEKEKNGFVGSNFFHIKDNFQRILETRLNDANAWDKYGSLIYQVSSSVYQTFLPDFLESSPIYSEAYADVIEIWRNRNEARKTGLGDPFSINLPFSPSTLIEGLLLLTRDDIEKLVNSQQCKYYRSTIYSDLSVDLLRKEVLNAYSDYRNLIDETVLKRLGIRAEKDNSAINTYILEVLDSRLGKTFVSLGFSLFGPVGTGAQLILDFILGTQRQTVAEILQDKNDDLIDSENEVKKRFSVPKVSHLDIVTNFNKDRTKDTMISHK